MHSQHGIKLIVIDYLQLLPLLRAGRRIIASRKWQRFPAALRAWLRSWVPVIVLCQLNREMRGTRTVNRGFPTSANPAPLSRTPIWLACFTRRTPRMGRRSADESEGARTCFWPSSATAPRGCHWSSSNITRASSASWLIPEMCRMIREKLVCWICLLAMMTARHCSPSAISRRSSWTLRSVM